MPPIKSFQEENLFSLMKNAGIPFVQKALGNKIKDTYGSINKAESYKLLCLSGKVDYVTEEEWLSLKQKAIELLTNRLKTEINTASWHTEILELLSIEKPSLFPDKEWAELQNKMNESYFALKAKEGRFFSDSNSTLKEIEQPKPNGILDDFWVEYIENLKKEYFKQLSKDLEFSATPYILLNSKTYVFFPMVRLIH